MNGRCVYCTFYSFQICLCNIIILQALLLLGPLSTLPPNHHSVLTSHHPMAPVLYHASEHQTSCSFISISTTLHLLPRLLPTCSLSRPTNFLVPLSVLSLLNNLQSLHHHEPFQQRSWSSLGDPYLLTVTLPVCVSECPRLLFFYSLCKVRLPKSVITNATLLKMCISTIF